MMTSMMWPFVSSSATVLGVRSSLSWRAVSYEAYCTSHSGGSSSSSSSPSLFLSSSGGETKEEVGPATENIGVRHGCGYPTRCQGGEPFWRRREVSMAWRHGWPSYSQRIGQEMEAGSGRKWWGAGEKSTGVRAGSGGVNADDMGDSYLFRVGLTGRLGRLDTIKTDVIPV